MRTTGVMRTGYDHLASYVPRKVYTRILVTYYE